MPMDLARYPADWRQISRRIRFRADGRCEWCGAENLQSHPETGSRVILTVAHLGVARPDGTPGDKHDKMDVRDENLAALCQRCHLNYDRDEHQVNAAATRRRRRLQAGQIELPLIDRKDIAMSEKEQRSPEAHQQHSGRSGLRPLARRRSLRIPRGRWLRVERRRVGRHQ